MNEVKNEILMAWHQLPEVVKIAVKEIMADEGTSGIITEIEFEIGDEGKIYEVELETLDGSELNLEFNEEGELLDKDYEAPEPSTICYYDDIDEEIDLEKVELVEKEAIKGDLDSAHEETEDESEVLSMVVEEKGD